MDQKRELSNKELNELTEYYKILSTCFLVSSMSFAGLIVISYIQGDSTVLFALLTLFTVLLSIYFDKKGND